MSQREPVLVAAIDFGTTYSGWSFLFKHEFESDPTKSYARNWNSGDLISSKTASTILIAPDGYTFEKFGYEAEKRYTDLVNEKRHQDFYYFTRFKMALHDRINLKRDINLDEINGKKLPALRVFSLAIKFMHDDLLSQCNTTLANDIRDGDIDWVITVPAIWNDAAKQFMREAAEKAGISNSKLTVALEPEAAALFCKHYSVKMHVGTKEQKFGLFSPGSKYIVLDAGGGTVDITVHEVLPEDKIKELHSASGGAWGGTQVDTKFFQFLDEIFGPPIMKKFLTDNMADYLDMLCGFEIKKRQFSPKTRKTVFCLPGTLVDLFVQETEHSLKEAIEKMELPGTVKLLSGYKLHMDAVCMRSFFDPAVESILEHLGNLIQDPMSTNVKFLLMVGGFSESPYLHEAITMKFQNMKIVKPNSADQVVLKGAAIFGFSRGYITERVSKYTYGFCGYTKFREGIDPEEHAVIKKGVKKLNYAFFNLVKKGESLGINERREWNENRVASNDNDVVTIPLYASEEYNPRGAWSENTREIGRLTAKIGNMAVPRKERKFRVSGIFGNTEIELQVLEISTGKLTSVTFDAL